VFHDRTLRTLFLALVAVLLTGVILPRRSDPVVNAGGQSERFWTKKARWGPEFAVVLAGDSRVYRGLAPEEMAAALPGKKIANFGFPGCGYTRSYLDAVDGLLDAAGADETIVLGVTPHSLTAHAAEGNGFLAERSRPRGETYSRLYLSPAREMFRATTPTEIFDALDGSSARSPVVRIFQTFHADGWVATDMVPEQPDSALDEYVKVLTQYRVDPALEDDLIAKVDGWTKRGVRVFAFRPPSSTAMVDLENRLSRFDEAALAERVRRAGGLWLTVDARRYESYDGSHLNQATARRLSRDVAEQIAAHRP
jgi:hypothetical protein